jgi:SAM-dependent methyltransferase
MSLVLWRSKTLTSQTFESERSEDLSTDRANDPTHSGTYDAAYFEWQQTSGKFGGWANVDKYRTTIAPEDRVLDFGCGGGFLLANLNCVGRFGITVFANANEAMQSLGPGSLDVIISDNALEHALEPWRELQLLRPLLKPGGRLHFVVPCESIGWRFKSDDINQHVYSWSPQSFGNLLKAAGFDVVHSRPYIHKWPPRGMARHLSKLGRPVFNAAARIWGHIDRRWFQVEALAKRPVTDVEINPE